MAKYVDELNWIDITLPTDNDPRYQIQYSDIRGIYFDMGLWQIVDPKHPRCYSCGRFTKIKWDRHFTGPCPNCYDHVDWWY